MDTAARPALDRATLTPVVRRAVGSATAVVDCWGLQPLGTAFAQMTGGLYRVSGRATDRGRSAPWSAVLKICRDPGIPGQADPRHTFYWKREYLAYASGQLGGLPP